jgi:Family of unknown function (DUF5335)
MDTMRAQEVPRRNWATFCQQFSQDHQEWLVDVSQDNRDTRTPYEALELPLDALTLHLDHAQEVLSVVVRKDGMTKGHVYKSFARPSRIVIEEARPDVKLHIDSTDGSTATIRFRRVTTPDYESAAQSGISEWRFSTDQ